MSAISKLDFICLKLLHSTESPRDVAHLQFKCRIAFKLVWVPPLFQNFVLVDDDGKLLAQDTPTGNRVPEHRQRAANWRAVGNGKYSAAALQLGAERGAGGDEERE